MHKHLNRKRIATVVGARPQFVKAFALSRALREASDIEEILIHTGQHFDDNMSEIFFDELGMTTPQYRFTTRASEHGAATAHMLTCIEGVLLEQSPDAVIVYGDTNSTLAGALAAAKLRIPVIHIEAGMRAFRRKMPEEINRVVTDHVSDVLLCSTRTAVQNLAREGITQNVHLAGDLMYDATLAAIVLAEIRSPILQTLSLAPRSYAVATVHRARNTNDPKMLKRVLGFIAAEAKTQPIVFPVHPRTKQAAMRAGINLHEMGCIVTEPLGYLDMCQLLHNANVIMTDSGGLQKEAYFHRVPCITLRDVTEWVETIECGWNRLWTVGEYRNRQEIEDYGDGRAATKIVDIIRSGVIRPSRASA
jgi:UDP-GlcNAc3NAcA epimerase